MTYDRIAAFALTMSLAALPSAAQSEDAPGFFRIPGTSTSMKFNGYAVLDGAYDLEERLPAFGTIADAINRAQASGIAQGNEPRKTWTMTANRTRFGVTTVSSSDFGDITFRFEGDFLNGQLRLRHGYGTFGNLVFGQTWSTFLDLDAAPETVDFTGGIGTSNFDTPRIPQVRYTLPLTEKMSVAMAFEADRTDSTDSPFPGGFVGAFTFTEDWGHVGARILAQKYSTFVARTPTTPELKYDDMAFAWQLSGHLKIHEDKLQAALLSGEGLGAYGAGTFQDIGLNDAANQRHEFWKSTGLTLGYAHPWSDMLRSNLVMSWLKFKRDGAFTNDSDIEKVQNIFLNTFCKFTDRTEFGLEYAYGRAIAFGHGLLKADGTTTDTIKESRIQMALLVNLF